MESHVPDPNDPIHQSPPPDHRLSVGQSPTKDLNESISQTNPQLNQSVTNAGPASKSLLVQQGAGHQGQMLNRPELRLENQINFMITLISALTVLIIWWNLIFVEAFCLLRFACVPDGVETPMFVMKSMFVIFFFVLIFAPTIYYVVRHGDKSGVRCFKWINWLLIIAMIILFIVSFAKMGSFGTDDVVDKWSQLSTNDRLQQYDDDISNLVDVNKKNLLLHAIYNIVLTVLFVVISIALYNYDFILPERWSSDSARKSRVSFAEDSLIVVSKNKPDLQAERVRTDQRSRALELPQIDEERASLVGDSHIPQVNLFKPTSTYDNYPVRDRTFASPDHQNRRDFDDPSIRSPIYGLGQADRNYPRSPQGLTRGGYDNEDLRTRDQGDLNRGENNPINEIEMATSNYVGNLTRKKRTLGE